MTPRNRSLLNRTMTRIVLIKVSRNGRAGPRGPLRTLLASKFAQLNAVLALRSVKLTTRRMTRMNLSSRTRMISRKTRCLMTSLRVGSSGLRKDGRRTLRNSQWASRLSLSGIIDSCHSSSRKIMNTMTINWTRRCRTSILSVQWCKAMAKRRVSKARAHTTQIPIETQYSYKPRSDEARRIKKTATS